MNQLNVTSVATPLSGCHAKSVRLSVGGMCRIVRMDDESLRLTVASSSNFPKSSLRSLTNSWAVHWEARLVKPTMSAKRMLRERQRERQREGEREQHKQRVFYCIICRFLRPSMLYLIQFKKTLLSIPIGIEDCL